MSEPLMEVRDLAVQLQGPQGRRRGRSTVSPSTGEPGEIFGVVGESGCGKSTLARALLGLVEPAAGEVALHGGKVEGKSELGELRRRVQMIFQDPYQTLNPRQRVRSIVAEPLVVQRVDRAEHEGRVRRALEDVGLDPERFGQPLPAPALRRPAPAGGDRRRAGARARGADLRRAGLDARRLGADPDPHRARRASGAPRALALLFITHDLSLAWSLCDRLAVMYLGRVVEQGSGRGRDRAAPPPLHAGAGRRDPGARPPEGAAGASCSAASCPTPPTCRPGCRFHPRCPRRFEPCDRVDPPLIPTGGREQMAACLLHDPSHRRRSGDGRRWLSAGARSPGRSAAPRARPAERDHRRARRPGRPRAGGQRRARPG